MGTRTAGLLLAGIIVTRASACMFSKLLLAGMGPFTLMALRFGIVSALLALLFGGKLVRADRATIRRGAAIGALFFIVMSLETMALCYSASSTVCFLENTAIVLVPLLEAAHARRAPRIRDIACTLAVLAGVGLLTLQEGISGFGTGEALSLAAAVFYALAIMVTARAARAHDSLTLGVLQVGVMGIASPIAAFALESPALPGGGMEWLYLAVLVFVCTGFGFTLQPVAQRYLSAEQAGIFCALNPLTAGICGTLFLAEPLGSARLAGMALVLLGIMVASLKKPDPENPLRQSAAESNVPPSPPTVKSLEGTLIKGKRGEGGSGAWA